MLCCPDGKPFASILLKQLLQHEELQQACAEFKQQAQPACLQVSASKAANICLLQGEAAALNARHLPGLIIGSQDATTCLTAIIWCPRTSHLWAAHIDQPLSSGDTAVLLHALQQMQQPQLYISGAYCDERNLGPSLMQQILQQLHSLAHHMSLQLLCVGASNTAVDGSPCVCSLVLDTAQGIVHPWLFEDRGPELPRRFAAQYCRYDDPCNLVNIWSCGHQQLQLQPFDPTVLNSWAIMRYEQMIDWPDERILEVMSTSPRHEPAWFCQDMRDKMQFLISAQEPDSPERAAAAQTARYSWCKETGGWKAVKVAEPVAASVV